MSLPGAAASRPYSAAIAAAAIFILFLFVALSSQPEGRSVLGAREARLQELNLGGYDGSGDQSAFAPAGYGMDAQTAVDDGESITSSVEKMLHPPKPKVSPKLGTVVEGKDGQRYDSIPADIMAKFRRAQKVALRGSSASADDPEEAPHSQHHSRAAESPEPSAKPPAWVVAEAKKLQANAAEGGSRAQAAEAKSRSRSLSTRPTLDTYDEYKAEYEASLKSRARAPAAAAVRGATGGATHTEMVTGAKGGSAGPESVKETAQEMGRLEERVARQQGEREDELEHLASDVRALTQAVIKMKQGQQGAARARRTGAAQAPADARLSNRWGNAGAGGRGGAGRRRQRAAEAEGADRKAEWDALRERLKEGGGSDVRARGRLAARQAPSAESREDKSKMSFFGLMRQQRALARAPPRRASSDSAAGEEGDLSVGYREQQEHDAERAALAVPATARGSSASHSKLSFWAQMRNRQAEALSGGKASSAKMAALHRIFARTAAGGFLAGKASIASGKQLSAARTGPAGEALSARRSPPPARCLSPSCTCVSRGNSAVQVAHSPLALTQLHGLGAQAHCVYYTVHGPSGHALSVRLLNAGDQDRRWSNYGSVATGCLSLSLISSAALASSAAAPQLAVQDTVTGESHSFGLGLQCSPPSA